MAFIHRAMEKALPKSPAPMIDTLGGRKYDFFHTLLKRYPLMSYSPSHSLLKPAARVASATKNTLMKRAAKIGLPEEDEDDPYSQKSIDAGSLTDPSFGKEEGRVSAAPAVATYAEQEAAARAKDPKAQQDRQMAATQKVAFLNQYEGPLGGGLKSLEAMQSPDYELGSGSPLNQPSRSLESKSGAMRRSARRLRRQGYTGAAQRMALAGEQQKLTEPSITSQATRAQEMGQRMEAGRLRKEESDLRTNLSSFLKTHLGSSPYKPKSLA